MSKSNKCFFPSCKSKPKFVIVFKDFSSCPFCLKCFYAFIRHDTSILENKDTIILDADSFYGIE